MAAGALSVCAAAWPAALAACRSVAQLTAYSELTDRNHVLNLWNFLEQKLAEGYTYFYGAKSTFAENGAGVSELTRKYESRVIIQHLLDYYARYRPHGMVTSIYVNRNDQPINVNRTTACTVHRDEKNAGHSSTMTLGDFDGGALEVFPSPFHNALPPKNRSLLPGAGCTRLIRGPSCAATETSAPASDPTRKTFILDYRD